MERYCRCTYSAGEKIRPTTDYTVTKLTLYEPPQMVEVLPEQGMVQPSLAGAPVAAVWEPHPVERGHYQLALTQVKSRTAFPGEEG